MTMTTVSFKPFALNSDQHHYQNVFKPITYRGFYITRTPTYALYFIRDEFGKEETGLHGQYTKIETAKSKIDDFLERKEKKAETENHTPHT